VEYQVNDSEAEAMITHELQFPVVERARNKTPKLKQVIVIGEGEYLGAHRFKDFIKAVSA
jgi:hypothetical protein